MTDFWNYGDKAALAKLADISMGNLYEILYRKRGVSKDMAMKLEEASADALRKKISWEDWLFNKSTKHKAFYGRAKK